MRKPNLKACRWGKYVLGKVSEKVMQQQRSLAITKRPSGMLGGIRNGELGRTDHNQNDGVEVNQEPEHIYLEMDCLIKIKIEMMGLIQIASLKREAMGLVVLRHAHGSVERQQLPLGSLGLGRGDTTSDCSVCNLMASGTVNSRACRLYTRGEKLYYSI